VEHLDNLREAQRRRHFVRPTSEDILAVLDDVVYDQEEPLGGTCVDLTERHGVVDVTSKRMLSCHLWLRKFGM
jgi:hypothetical protein